MDSFEKLALNFEIQNLDHITIKIWDLPTTMSIIENIYSDAHLKDEIPCQAVISIQLINGCLT